MKKMFKKAIDCITAPFIAVAVLLDESRRMNLDGDWDEYWRKKNERTNRKHGKSRRLGR